MSTELFSDGPSESMRGILSTTAFMEMSSGMAWAEMELSKEEGNERENQNALCLVLKVVHSPVTGTVLGQWTTS